VDQPWPKWPSVEIREICFFGSLSFLEGRMILMILYFVLVVLICQNSLVLYGPVVWEGYKKGKATTTLASSKIRKTEQLNAKKR
jgi:hypothetical protein